MRYLLSALVLYLVSFAEGNEYKAQYILPQIGQRGTEVQVVLVGSHLETAEEVLFYKPGIQCSSFEALTEYPRNGRIEKAGSGEAVRLTFTIQETAEIGEYFFRLRTKRHLSELLSFWVTPFPVIDEIEPFSTKNDDPSTAQRIPLNSTVSGYQPQGPPNDFDYYSVTLTKGQRCTAQILSARLGTYHYGGLTDMALEAYSPDGKRVARCDDSPLLAQDPVISFFADVSGDYLILARQQMDYETMPRHYALHIGDFARPVVTFPLGGKSGAELPLTVFHEDGTTKKTSIGLPENTGPFEASLIPFQPGIPTPLQLKVADFPNILETPDHNLPEQAQPVNRELPVALNGIIAAEGERDWFRFSAKAGERCRVRAYARTLGSKLDPFIWIRPAPGNRSSRDYEEDDSLWDGHDWEGHHYRHQVKDRLDPVFMFEPDQDGDYLIGIGDTRREFGPDYIYRVEFQPHEDSVFTYFPPYPSKKDIVRDAIEIHRGSTYSRPVAIQNGFGSQYDGPMTLEAIGLPPGIEFECPVFTKNAPVILTLFTAPADTKLQCGLFELVPRPAEKEMGLRGALAITTGATQRRGSYDMVFNKTRKAAFAVLEEAPFTVELTQPKIPLAKNAELDLTVSVNRKDGFEGALYAEMDWLPPGITKQPPLIIPAGEETAQYKISATSQAKEGVFRLSINVRENEGGNAISGNGFHFVAAPSIEVEVTDPYLTIELSRAAIEQGTEGKIEATVNHLRPFQGTASATLLRLPTGVDLIAPVAIKPGQRQISFPVRVAGDALVGQTKQISCDVAITDAGQTIHQQSGDGVIRIDAKRGL